MDNRRVDESAYRGIGRRSFLAGALSLPLAGCLAPGGFLSSKPRMSFGVVSDIHITDWESTEIFRKALRHFRDQGVDAVMIVGDMADHGILPQLENTAKAWYEVFPNDTAPDGRPVEKLFVYGNHDPEGLKYRDKPMDKAFRAMHLTYEEADKLQLARLGMAKCWERCFNEPYEPIYRKNVCGYDFIGGHWDNIRGNWKGILDLEDWFKANISKIDTDRPFFYFQHATPRGTIYGEDSWGDDSGIATRALMPYANAVAFSGHSHRPLTDLRSYWRGEFTSIGTSSLSYVCLPEKLRLNRPDYRANLDCRHGQIVSVYDDRLVIVRRDFIHDEDLDDAVVLEMPTKVSSFSTRAVMKCTRPAFPAQAQVAVAKKGGALELTFPGAFANATARPFDYRVVLYFQGQDKEGKAWKKRDEGRFFQPEAAFARKRAAAKDVVLSWASVPEGATTVAGRVIPMNSYGGEGTELAIPTTNLG